jgi:hypothetical protein
LGTIKANIEIVKELLEPEYVYEEEIVTDSTSLRVIESRYDTRPRIPFELGESSFIGICDFNSNINILSYHAYELISYFIDDPDLEPTDANLRLSNRTSKKFKGILHNTQVSVGSFVYPIDFYVIDLPYKPFNPIILGRHFFILTKANTENKKEVISLHVGEEEIGMYKPGLVPFHN